MLDGVEVEGDALRLFPELENMIWDKQTHLISCETLEPTESKSDSTAMKSPVIQVTSETTLSSQPCAHTLALDDKSKKKKQCKREPDELPEDTSSKPMKGSVTSSVEEIEDELEKLSQLREKKIKDYKEASGRKQKNAISASKNRLSKKIAQYEAEHKIQILKSKKALLKSEKKVLQSSNTALEAEKETWQAEKEGFVRQIEKLQSDSSLLKQMTVVLPMFFEENRRSRVLNQGLLDSYKEMNTFLILQNNELKQQVQALAAKLEQTPSQQSQPHFDEESQTVFETRADSFTPSYQQKQNDKDSIDPSTKNHSTAFPDCLFRWKLPKSS